MNIRPMAADDYADVAALWRRTEGVGLNESDTAEAIAAYLRRNPQMSAVMVLDSGEIVAAVLCGHDGRRGYLHHLAVDAAHRRQGIAARLLDWCFERLRNAGIPKCNLFLFDDNHAGAEFWTHNGWSFRNDLLVFQKVVAVDE